MKNNNKGFMLLETLIVSCIVLGVLIYMYSQFRNININYQRIFKYNTVSSLYKTNEIKKFIESDAYLEMVGRLEDSSNLYYDITACDVLLYNSSDLCSKLYDSLGLEKLVIMNENLSLIRSADITTLPNGLQQFIYYLSDNYTGNYRRIVASYEDGTYASVRINVLNNTYNFLFDDEAQEFIVPASGNYKIELWGASGGEGTNEGNKGKGAYTSGNIYLEKDTKLYIYTGGSGGETENITNLGGYNGGGYSGNNQNRYSYGGGGATDVRLVGGLWNNFGSLKSRIMVAAGGGGSFNSNNRKAGDGGALTGQLNTDNYTGSWNRDGVTHTSESVILSSASQTNPSFNNYANTTRDGKFGYSPQTNTSGYGGGGGAGYYAGANGFGVAGSGGSSFISGYYGCNAIAESSEENNIIHTNQTVHYSGFVFSNSSMIAGNAEMPNYNGGTMIGNSGNGYARITVIE